MARSLPVSLLMDSLIAQMSTCPFTAELLLPSTDLMLSVVLFSLEITRAMPDRLISKSYSPLCSYRRCHLQGVLSDKQGARPRSLAGLLLPKANLYLRLSKNNIKTLIKLCKDAGLDVDIHPHMVETEIDSKKIFDHHCSTAL
ncbi:hypothetical protein HispidOSU_015716 [Sigmodon hispidus]